MGKINLSRVILGGIVAGIIVNVSEGLLHDMVMKSQFEEALRALGKTQGHSGTVMFWWLVWGFVMGIASVWLYAAIRPRYGAGPATAVRAGIAAWILSCVLMTIAMTNLDLFPFNPLVLVWTLVEAIVATLAGAALYKEGPA